MPSSQNLKWKNAAYSGILGWILDAYDFFVLVFLIDVLAQHFHVKKSAIVVTMTITLAMRPVGGFLLGAWADRIGRRLPLMVCVIYFSVITALTPFAPNYAVFVLLRALYGIGMGGYWGIGASLVMESSPIRWRGLLSGVMQAGYPFGYLLAAISMRWMEPYWGWQSMFLSGLFLAAIISIFTMRSPESEAWHRHRLPGLAQIFRTLADHKRSFAYLLLVMAGMTCLSHGTQDLYPDFLKSIHHFSNASISTLAIVYNLSAIAGALVIGHASERFGRRYSMIGSLGIALLAIPAWAFGATYATLMMGAVLMQFGVQGAFGVIPAHLNELSPSAIRSLFPGFVYQLGVLIGSPAVAIEYALRDHIGYQWALVVFETCAILSVFVLCAFGPERRGRDFNTLTQE
ncbi:MAG TPA: MFS transporter [Acidobacteriaceae bacterium]|jgi:SHS family lactate transporter-like MFS transporter|nr:MFS transporter [Acidobacteriaceae bacterium]